MMNESDNIMKEFLVESYENLDQLDRDLMVLEKDPGNHDILASIFRTIHTIKGTCGFLGLSKLEAVSHAGENLLGLLREGKISLDSERTTVLLTMVDAIRAILAKIEETGKEGNKNYSKLIQSIVAVLGAAKDRQTPEDSEAAGSPPEIRTADKRQDAVLGNSLVNALFPAASAPTKSSGVVESGGPMLLTRIGGMAAINAVIKEFYRRVHKDAELKPFFAKIQIGLFRNQQAAALTLVLGGKQQEGAAAFWGAHSKLGITEDLSPRLRKHLTAALKSQGVEASLQKEILAALSSVVSESEKLATKTEISSPASASQTPELEEVNLANYHPSAGASSTGGTEQLAANGSIPNGSSVADSTIRVDVVLLDKLMNLVGELVLARNQVLQFSTKRGFADTAFVGATQRLNLVTSELQEGVMRTRMQPIGNIWDKFPRVVRDLALSCGKKIHVQMEGKDTELDKTLIEAIKDPLTHLVRNAADHGIETPEVRVATGKKADGNLLLRAYHEGGHVNIEIIDDGAGIDLEGLRKKALHSGLIPLDKAQHMSEREILNLIFLPGFSTATKVTNISGRGVGMDVVKTNIERIGGTIDVQSVMGKGTTVKVKIPLTLAIIPALVVTCGGDRYSIPQVSLLELVRLDGQGDQKRVEMIHGAPVYRLREKLLPLVDLGRELKVTNQFSHAESARETSHGETAMGRSPVGDAIDVVVRLEGEEAKKGVGLTHGEPVGELHGSLLPSVKLSREPQAEGEAVESRPGTGQSRYSIAGTSQSGELGSGLGQSGDGVNIVVLQADNCQFGLVVEGIHDTEEIVVKPLGKHLKNLDVFSGATIMGDGTVALILDVAGLGRRASILSDQASELEEEVVEEVVEATSGEAQAGERQTLLVFEVGEGQRLAMPLPMVARLEEVPHSSVEYAGRQAVVQYRGEIMPIVYLAKVFGSEGITDPVETAADDKFQMVVYSQDGQSVGLVVGQIQDIVDEVIKIERDHKLEGFVGSAVVQGRVANLVDVPWVINQIDSKFFATLEADKVEV